MHSLIKQAQALLAGALFLVACGAAQEPAKEPDASGSKTVAEGEVCPPVEPGPPPVCPDGCEFDGTECRAKRPIIIYDKPILPTSTAPTATAPAPTATAPSSP